MEKESLPRAACPLIAFLRLFTVFFNFDYAILVAYIFLISESRLLFGLNGFWRALPGYCLALGPVFLLLWVGRMIVQEDVVY